MDGSRSRAMHELLLGGGGLDGLDGSRSRAMHELLLGGGGDWTAWMGVDPAPCTSFCSAAGVWTAGLAAPAATAIAKV